MEKLSDIKGNFSVQEFKLRNRRHFINKNTPLCHLQKNIILRINLNCKFLQWKCDLVGLKGLEHTSGFLHIFFQLPEIFCPKTFYAWKTPSLPSKFSLSFTSPVNPSLVLPIRLKHPFLRPPLSLTYTFLYLPSHSSYTHAYLLCARHYSGQWCTR